MENKSLTPIIFLIIIVAGLVGYIAWDKYYQVSNHATPPIGTEGGSGSGEGTQVVCTTDAKQCPDGTYVGRVAPSCEFAPCPIHEAPEEGAETSVIIPPVSTWETYSDAMVTFKYPAQLPTTYVRGQVWPPAVKVTEGTFACTAPTHKVQRREYCVTETSEGAAGSTYTTYAYTFAKSGKLLTLTFTLKKPQCENYTDQEKKTCAEEQGMLSVDMLVDGIAQTITLR